jgi:hypothetical protein
MFKENSSYGKAEISPQEAIVGRCGTFVIKYTLGQHKINEGGRIVFIIPKAGFSSPKLFPDEDRIKEMTQKGIPIDNSLGGFVWANASNKDVQFELSTSYPNNGGDYLDSKGVLCRHPGAPGSPVCMTLKKGALSFGDKIELTYGDASSGSAGAICGIYAHTAAFPVWLDPDGTLDGPLMGYHPADNTPTVKVKPEKPEKIEVIAPSKTRLNQKFKIHVVLRDKYDNVCDDYTGAVNLRASSAVADLPDKIQFTENDKGICIVNGLSLNEYGKCLFFAEETSCRLHCRSNPLTANASADEEQIFWGDIHGHTESCDGLKSPKDALTYARDAAALDFAAISSHDRMLNEKSWQKVKTATKEMNNGKSFVTFLGYEFTASKTGGHRNVYTRSNDVPLYKHIDPETSCAEELLKSLKGEDVLVIPHHTPHPTMTTNWDYHNPEIERLVEIYSEWGCSEYEGNPRPICRQHQHEKCDVKKDSTVQAALSRGYRLGFTGGSDNHSGQLGRCSLMGCFARRKAYHCGITAVLSDSLDKESIWQALKARHCYATTGARIVLDFSINQDQMGDQIIIDKDFPETLKIKIRASGTNNIEKIELLRNNKVVHSENVNSEDIELDLTERFDKACLCKIKDRNEMLAWYYARITQTDSEMAWSSPIWLVKSTGR